MLLFLLTFSTKLATVGQNDGALRLPLLQGVPVWEEVRSSRGQPLLCEMLRKPVFQHM